MQSEKLGFRKRARFIELRFLSIMCLISLVKCKMEPFIAGGYSAPIIGFPHSVFMNVHCFSEESDGLWICGASIINQMIALTAAHCLDECSKNSTISVSVGDAHKDQGVKSTVHSFFIHEDFVEHLAINDIALVRFKNMIRFSDKVKRVVLMQNPPYFEKAQIAGWGITDEEYETPSDVLKYVDQFVKGRDHCKLYTGNIPAGTICATSDTDDDYSTSKSLHLDANVKRVALMKKPPYNEKGHVAGWGLIDDVKPKYGKDLKYVDQYVWKNEACKNVIHRLPHGTFCASSEDTKTYSSR
ncbi:hypothetical protein PYW08_000765 [Mythimna loreyi]|uniref:Uncharacterized protein n=1 Tax=Mythimna loreyi TaxID=667449 RepID=A0ACC2QYU2_9NEOP|nr:hypothetical protein PYW08_000765 [Mythimna loreyi]